MTLKYTDGDYPEVGDKKSGYILVCHGDDTPSEWVDWLSPLVQYAKALLSIAEEHRVPMNVGKESATISHIHEFLDAAGIRLETQEWQGTLISGNYYLGWVKNEERARLKTEHLIRIMYRTLEARESQEITQELSEIIGLCHFVDNQSDNA